MPKLNPTVTHVDIPVVLGEAGLHLPDGTTVNVRYLKGVVDGKPWIPPDGIEVTLYPPGSIAGETLKRSESLSLYGQDNRQPHPGTFKFPQLAPICECGHGIGLHAAVDGDEPVAVPCRYKDCGCREFSC